MQNIALSSGFGKNEKSARLKIVDVETRTLTEQFAFNVYTSDFTRTNITTMRVTIDGNNFDVTSAGDQFTAAELEATLPSIEQHFRDLGYPIIINPILFSDVPPSGSIFGSMEIRLEITEVPPIVRTTHSGGSSVENTNDTGTDTLESIPWGTETYIKNPRPFLFIHGFGNLLPDDPGTEWQEDYLPHRDVFTSRMEADYIGYLMSPNKLHLAFHIEGFPLWKNEMPFQYRDPAKSSMSKAAILVFDAK